MDTITIDHISFFGIHGAEKYEHRAPQEFNITLTLSQWEREYHDTLALTYDYKQAIVIVEKVIKGPRQVLIETLAETIAREILSDDERLYSATVKLEKPSALRNGTPSVTVTKYQELHSDLFLPFHIESVLEQLIREGGVSFPLITETYRKKLLIEAKSLKYIERPKVVGKGLVHEDLEVAEIFPDESVLAEFKQKFEEILYWKLSHTPLSPFQNAINFNEMRVQHYYPDSIGITTHRDGASYHNLIAILVLEGKSKFALAENRAGDNPRYLDATPGTIILMRAPGFLGSSYRPFHFVTDIHTDRYILGMGQKVTNAS